VEPTDGTPDIDFVLASREGDLEAFAWSGGPDGVSLHLFE
jgi:hypothetical protein